MYKLPLLSALFISLCLGGCGGHRLQPKKEGSYSNTREGQEKIMNTHTKRNGVIVKRLENGLTIVVEENHNAPVVAIQAWVKVGSADEPEELRGIAHLFEHILFKGTEKRKVGEIARAVEAAGGEINAYTSYDETVYFLILASSFFGEGLDIIADALMNPAFDPVELKREIAVVAEEELKQTNDIPEHRLADELMALSYSAHPYGRRILGEAETLKKITQKEVSDFHKTSYTADRIVIVVVGDVDADRAETEVAAAFKNMPTSQSPRPVRPKEPERTELSAKTITLPLSESYIGLAWKIPRLQDNDTPALDALSVILGYGESSRLAGALKIKRPLVSDIAAYAFTPKDEGLFTISASFPKENYEKVLKRLFEEVNEVRTLDVSASEVEKAVQMITAEAIYRRETVEGEAHKLGFYQSTVGDYNYDADYYRRLASITPSEIRRVAEKYLDLNRLAAVLLTPKNDPELTDKTFAADIKRFFEESVVSSERARGKNNVSTLPVIKKLNNGLTLVMKVEGNTPIVAMQAVSLAGSRIETEETNGINKFIANMFTRGTARMSGDELRKALDHMAAAMSGFTGENSTGLKATFLARDFERGLSIFLDALFHPIFPEEELAAERVSLINDLKAQEDDLPYQAFKLFQKTLFTAHPYRLDHNGSERNINRFSRQDLREYHKKIFSPQRIVLSIVGSFDPERALAQIEELSQTAGEKFDFNAPPPEKPPIKPRQAQLVTEKEQAHIVLGFLGSTITSDDRYAIEVMNGVLSGQGGRLFNELREKEPLAYSINSYFSPGVEPGFIAVYMGTSPEKLNDAVLAILRELRKIKEDGIAEEELERTKRHLVGMHAVELQRASARASIISFNLLYGLGVEDYINYPKEIEKVTLDDVKKVAQKYLDTDNYVLAVIAPESK